LLKEAFAMSEDTRQEDKGLTRRGFLKTSGGAALAGVAAGAMLTGSRNAFGAPIPKKWDQEVDVVILGYGTTGLPAAIEAHDAGASVLILEKLDWLGGSLLRCGGGMAGANTIVQKALGIVDDTPDKLYNYVMACGEGFVDPELVRVYADSAGKAIDWMIEALGGQPVSQWSIAEKPLSLGPGVNFGATPVFYEKYGVKPIMECHWFTPVAPKRDKTALAGGTALFKILDDATKARRIPVMLKTSLQELVATPEKEVLGVKAINGEKTMHIRAKKAVIIGTGGFIWNEQMMKKYLPSHAVGGGKGVVVVAIHQDNDHGEGILAGQAIGADLATMGHRPPDTSTVGSGGLKINTKAEVLDVYGKPIPRLYAGGRATGGLMSNQYPSCGTAVSTAVCFGRIAGRNAAKL